jgi:hypothetical protein
MTHRAFPPRPAWSDMTPAFQAGVTARTGPVHTARPPVDGGFTQGFAAVLDTHSTGPVFVKATPATSAIANSYSAEIHRSRLLTGTGLMPDLLWSGQIDGWVTLCFTAVDGRHPDITPGSPDIPAYLDAVARVQATPPPPGFPTRSGLPTNWQLVPHTVWPDRHQQLCDIAAQIDTSGPTLSHSDLRPDNALITPDGTVHVLDWADSSTAAPWIDQARAVFYLIINGHTPDDAHDIVHAAGLLHDTPRTALLNWAVLASGAWTVRRTWPVNPELQKYWSDVADAAVAWVCHLTGWDNTYAGPGQTA